MNYSTAIFLMTDDIRCIACTYEADEPHKPAKRTQFKTFDREVAVGDLLIVPTDTRHGMTVVKAVEVDVEPDLSGSSDIKWIVDRIAQSSYAQLLAREQTAIDAIKRAEKRRQRDELRKSLLADAEDELKALPPINPDAAAS